MLRCNKCDNPIDEERIKTHLSSTGQLPDVCVKCSDTPKFVGFMGESGGKEGRKTGYVLTTVDPRNKENMRRAIRCHRRSR